MMVPSKEELARLAVVYPNCSKFGVLLIQEYFEYFGVDPNVKNALEIGVANGDSTKFFANEIFPNAVVVGIDTIPPENPTQEDPNFGKVVFKSVYQQDSRSLRQLARERNFEVVVDDASHVGSLTRNCFDNIWPFMPSGAVYVIEDWRADYLLRMDMQDIIEDLTNNQEKYGIASVKNVVRGYRPESVPGNIKRWPDTPDDGPGRAISFFKKK